MSGFGLITSLPAEMCVLVHKGASPSLWRQNLTDDSPVVSARHEGTRPEAGSLLPAIEAYKEDDMSVEIQVFLAGQRMPTPEQWAETLRAHGFDVDLDTDFDVRDFSGFLPCKYKGHDAGFEYYFGPAGPEIESNETLRAATAGRDSVVSFVTHSDFREFATSVIASGVLCAISDGVLFDDQLVVASAAIAWARDGERSIQEELNK